jgi:hypothetical protein
MADTREPLLTPERLLTRQAREYEACGALLDAEDLWSVIRLVQRGEGTR